ncbi:hypothetical protein CMV_029043 [Castanea mollissima]|uniref:Uncharacterized protein n=1 Tax=Castanea mollissima TaxID=60419 RepID=A0A8J4QCU7_9ROSI|nr:hypothetical protein CMV_029043 [Castanea mollissima]
MQKVDRGASLSCCLIRKFSYHHYHHHHQQQQQQHQRFHQLFQHYSWLIGDDVSCISIYKRKTNYIVLLKWKVYNLSRFCS